MPLASCPRCEKMFNKDAFVVCDGCEEAEREDYEKIHDALAKYPNLSAEDLAEMAEVEADCVLRLVDTGRIEPISVSTAEGIKCGRCGAPAISKAKKLCEACLNEMNAQLAREQAKVKLGKKRKVEVGTALNVHDAIKDKRDKSR